MSYTRKTLKIFDCPRCGERRVTVEGMEKSAIATVKCGSCGLSRDVLVKSLYEAVDVYGDFIDIFYTDQELQRLEKRIKRLKIDNELDELSMCYSILSDLCKVKVLLLMEDEDNLNIDDVEAWNKKANHYKNLKKDLIYKNNKNFRIDNSKKFNIWEEEYYNVTDIVNNRRNQVKKSFDKILSIMLDKEIEELIIERKYLLEIVEERFLAISKKDSLPILKSLVRGDFTYFGIDVKYYKDLVKFIKIKF